MSASVSPSKTPDADTLLETFLAMVRIDSPSAGEDAMRDYLISRLQPFNLSYTVDEGGNLIVEIPPSQCAHEQVLVISGHMDVVPPCRGIQPQVKQVNGDTLITSDGTTVLGADDKSALAIYLEVLFKSLKEDSPRPPIRLIFTTREEVMLCGAKDLDPRYLSDASFSVTMDHTGAPGTIVLEAPTYIEFELTAHGKSTHAGIMPEQGVNAIQVLSHVINRMHLGRIDADTTSNIGFITGGKATNIVPDHAHCRGELRSHNPAVLTRELAHIEAAATAQKAAIAGTDFQFSHQVAFEHYQMPETHPGVLRVAEAAQKAGLTPKFIRTNGGSDNNIFVKHGLPGVVLSAAYRNPHELIETASLNEMLQCTAFLSEILEAFAREPI